MQGASAFEKVLDEQRGQNVRVFVVWEPVLFTDLASPSTTTLSRIPDARASQYWDKEHLVSQLLGERDRASVVWDYIAVYEPGKTWGQAPPEPAYSNVPVVRSIDEMRATLQRLLRAK